MTIYHLTYYSLSIFVLSIILLACSYNAEQLKLIEDGSDEAHDKLQKSHTKYQQVIATVGALAWMFTLVHATIAAAKLLAGLM